MINWTLIMMLLASPSVTDNALEPFLEVLTPGERISTKIDHVHIIGKTNSPIVEIRLNGRKLKDVKVKDSMFHYHLSYGWGLNEVTLMPIYSGLPPQTEVAVRLEILHSPSIIRQFRPLYPEYIFHDGEERDDCTACHAGVGGDPGKGSGTGICLDCHRDFRNRFKKHTEVEDATCTDCHSSTYDGVEYGDNPCFRCHQDRLGMFEQEYIHGPVAGGTCTICHEPHGSDYEKNLREPVQLLCSSCHDIEDELRKNVLHKPFEMGYCADCHDPHATNNKWVLIKSSEELCLNCHEERGSLAHHQHPYNVKPKKKLRAQLELTPRGRLECLSCHNPHATDVAHLLRTDQEFTCLGCHDDKS